MTDKVLKCPQCAAPIAPSPFARRAECPHCGSTIELDEGIVERARFQSALEEWCDPLRHGILDWVSIGGRRWTSLERIGEGERCVIYEAVRARWPSERVVLKMLVKPHRRRELDVEWENIKALRRPLGALLAFQFPDPVVRGTIDGAGIGPSEGIVFRCPPGRFASAAAVGLAYPSGIPARPAIWLWRRALEGLASLHRVGWCHGSVSLDHVLIEAGEHGARLIGFESAGGQGDELPRWAHAARHLAQRAGRPPVHDPRLDVAMSATVIAELLKSDSGVPEELLELLDKARRFELDPSESLAWEIRTLLGTLASAVYGAAAFCPLDIPSRSQRGKER